VEGKRGNRAGVPW